MRARRFRPAFDTLLQRITPSDIPTPAAPAVAALMDPATSVTSQPTSDPAESSTSIIDSLDPWMVNGPPQNSPTDILNPSIDPTTWKLTS